MKRTWRHSANYASLQIQLLEGQVLIKEYFDPGKDPNRHLFSFQEFLEDKARWILQQNYSEHLLQEVKEAIRTES